MPSWSVFMQPSELNTHGNVYRRIYLSIAFMICKEDGKVRVIYSEMVNELYLNGISIVFQ